MNRNYEFNLTPAYCLYNGAAVLEQNGASIRFLVENKNDAVLCGRLSRAFENHIANIRQLKDCPEQFHRLIKIDFENGTRSQLRKCVSKLYRAGEFGLVKDASDSEETKNQKEAAAVLLLDSILNEARFRKATDIHIEKSCVRLRINGRLEKYIELQSEKSAELIQRIKLLAGMNVIDNRCCQDGQFIYGNKKPFFLRVSTMSVVGEGKSSEESVVMRLLDTSRIPLALGELGFNSLQLEKLCGENGLIKIPNGLVLICGPTGSGKSTTVASLLVEIEKRSSGSLKIISLEDPPEYLIPGVTQVKIDERNGFSEAINHLFRQDPDVIMIGEIRDEESAATALRASLTGHLVFATLHSGGAAESIFRLENLGIQRNLLCQVLRGIICQQLNELGGKMRLYADIAIPSENFGERAITANSEEQLEKYVEHFTNYSEILCETMKLFKAQSRRSKGKKKSIIPFYTRGREDAGIHKGIV